jgi:hypothetical protein
LVIAWRAANQEDDMAQKGAGGQPGSYTEKGGDNKIQHGRGGGGKGGSGSGNSNKTGKGG